MNALARRGESLDLTKIGAVYTPLCPVSDISFAEEKYVDFMDWVRKVAVKVPSREDAIEFRDILLEQMTQTDRETEEYALLDYLQEHYRKVSEGEPGDSSPV